MPNRFLTILFRFVPIWLVLTAASGIVLAGCGGTKEPAVASNRVLVPGDDQAGIILDTAKQTEVRRILRSVAADYRPESPPVLVARGMHFDDVPGAVRGACNDAEMAVVSSSRTDEGHTFNIRTIEGWPATLTVSPTNDDTVYEATVIVGRFGDHAERADDLLTALEKQMRAYGRKKHILHPGRE